VYYLDHTESSSDVQLRDWTGEHAPLHAVPSGMAMLAHLPADQQDAYLAQPLAPCTPWTTLDPEALASRLTQIRSLGYGWGYEEFAEGINSVAAPVLGTDGLPLAALHVHGPAYRYPNPDLAHDHGLAVSAAANRLSAQLNE